MCISLIKVAFCDQYFWHRTDFWNIYTIKFYISLHAILKEKNTNTKNIPWEVLSFILFIQLPARVHLNLICNHHMSLQLAGKTSKKLRISNRLLYIWPFQWETFLGLIFTFFFTNSLCNVKQAKNKNFTLTALQIEVRDQDYFWSPFSLFPAWTNWFGAPQLYKYSGDTWIK